LPSLISGPGSTLQSRLYILFLCRINRSNKRRLFILNLDSVSFESLHEVEHVSFHFVWVCEFVERDYGPCFEGLLAISEELGSALSSVKTKQLTSFPRRFQDPSIGRASWFLAYMTLGGGKILAGTFIKFLLICSSASGFDISPGAYLQTPLLDLVLLFISEFLSPLDDLSTSIRGFDS